jgi:hypothetical protein
MVVIGLAAGVAQGTGAASLFECLAGASKVLAHAPSARPHLRRACDSVMFERARAAARERGVVVIRRIHWAECGHEAEASLLRPQQPAIA